MSCGSQIRFDAAGEVVDVADVGLRDQREEWTPGSKGREWGERGRVGGEQEYQ